MILLVDDNPVQLNSRTAILSRAGFSVTTAATAVSALEILDAHLSRLQLILTDHIMPGMDGVQFVTELRKRAPHVPVLVISGLPDAEDQYTGLGVYSLQKPCPPETLIAKVTELSGLSLPRSA